MNFSEETTQVLRNFSAINPGLAFKEGNVIKTISPNKTILAKATISEDIEQNAAIYDLSNFLGILALFEEPDIEFEDKRFVISSGRQKVNYTYASESMVLTAPEKEIKFPSPDVEIDVEWADINATLKAASMLGMEYISISGDGEKIYLNALDPETPSANKYDVCVSEECPIDEEFSVVFKTDNMKLIPANYKVSIALGKLARFQTDNVEYYIAIEKK